MRRTTALPVVFVLLVVAATLSACGSDAPAPPRAAPSTPASVPVGEEAARLAERVDSVVEPSPADASSATSVAAEDGEGTPSADEPPPPPPVSPDGARPMFERPEHVRGLYLNAWAAGSSRRSAELIELARRTEINTFVIDIKDASGYVSHASDVPLVKEVGADQERRIRDLPGLLRRLEAAGIYPIARIVIVKDPILVEARPELAIQDTAGGVWIDGKGIRWLNPFDERVWSYHVDLAREVAQMGFPEIQWDYVRFPDAPESDLERALYPGRGERSRPQAIRDFLRFSRDALSPLGVTVTADVFGVTTSARDVGIGQIWEEFIDVTDVALPMVYPSHYWPGSFGIARPNAHPYEVVYEALERALARSAEVEGAGTTRPWLQDFTLGPPPYGPAEVRAQIQATYDVGIDEWILWNPGSRYTEGALEPDGGWRSEPWIRVAGSVVPVSGRHRALELVDAAELDSMPEVPAREVVGDTVSGGVGPGG